jgi:hypothetical protein
MRKLRSNAWKTVTAHPVLMAGGAAFVGFALYALMRSHRPSVYSIREDPNRLSETAGGAVQGMDDSPRDALGQQPSNKQPEQPSLQAMQQPAPVRYPITPPTQPGKVPPSHPGNPAATPG